jgi:hypothetical protein
MLSKVSQVQDKSHKGGRKRERERESMIVIWGLSDGTRGGGRGKEMIESE